MERPLQERSRGAAGGLFGFFDATGLRILSGLVGHFAASRRAKRRTRVTIGSYIWVIAFLAGTSLVLWTLLPLDTPEERVIAGGTIAGGFCLLAIVAPLVLSVVLNHYVEDAESEVALEERAKAEAEERAVKERERDRWLANLGETGLDSEQARALKRLPIRAFQRYVDEFENARSSGVSVNDAHKAALDSAVLVHATRPIGCGSSSVVLFSVALLMWWLAA